MGLKRIRYHRRWLWGMGVVFAIAIGFIHAVSELPAQTPATTPGSAPVAVPKNAPASPASPAFPASPSPIPPTQAIPPVLPPPPAPPASTAAPLPLGGSYQDPAGRFKVGVLQGYKTSPLAGSVLIESPDGNLAYAVVAQSQPLGAPIGVSGGYDQSETLAKVATAVFQRGEGFQPGPPRPESGGGAVIDWTGALTIADKAQPVGGSILVRPGSQTILLLIITATQAGAEQVPAALAALARSLQPL